MNKKQLLQELTFCIKLWEEKGQCNFGKTTKCHECATPYLLLKLITGQIIHNKRLTLEEWKQKLNQT